MIGYEQALEITLLNVDPIGTESIPLIDAEGRVAANDLFGLVNSPSVDASMKDGYAVCSSDIAEATKESPVRLKRTGLIAAGMESDTKVTPGTAVRVLTGSRVPQGADAILAEEFAYESGNDVIVSATAEPGRNILRSGQDVSVGQMIVSAGTMINPGDAGILAAAGHEKIVVFKRPRVAIIATGTEVVAPGQPLPQGKLFASNLIMLNAWCRRYGLKTEMDIVKDDLDLIRDKLDAALQNNDAVITSGGAWTEDRDYIARILDELGWVRLFHRIKIGPGKAVGFGTVRGKPVFVLPGGPPSNLMAFLQIALPGLLSLAGHRRPGLPKIFGVLAESVKGRQIDWTQFVYARLEDRDDISWIHPLKNTSRLQDMAKAEAIIAIPDGVDQIGAGVVLPVQILKFYK